MKRQYIEKYLPFPFTIKEDTPKEDLLGYITFLEDTLQEKLDSKYKDFLIGGLGIAVMFFALDLIKI